MTVSVLLFGLNSVHIKLKGYSTVQFRIVRQSRVTPDFG
jgi:hypothetical protein